MIGSLRARLFAGILATVLVAVAVSLAIGIALTRDAVRDSAADQLSREADLLANAFSAASQSRPFTRGLIQALPFEGEAGSVDGIPFEGPPPGFGAEGQSLPVPPDEVGFAGPPGPDGPAGAAPQVLSLEEAGELLGEEVEAELLSTGAAEGRETIDGSDELFAARVLDTEVSSQRDGGGGQDAGATVNSGDTVLVLTRSASVGGDDFDPYLGGLLLASGLSGLLAALAAALLARRLSAPIRRASDASRELAAGRRPEPLPEEGPDELAMLARSFNEMTTQLERAREAERSVLLSVSHELRTPLTAIRGYAEGVEDGAVDRAEATRVIAAESARLERLVKDLLALARLEQGVLDFRAEPIDLGEIASDARRRLALVADERGVEVSLERNGAAVAIGDPDRALQVISNLIENAIRATPNGGIVSVVTEPGSVSVADSGPGIPAEDVPNAFERFHLRERAGAERGEGSGLGLAIVRELTEGMGGSVELASEPGKGAEFTVTLPTAT